MIAKAWADYNDQIKRSIGNLKMDLDSDDRVKHFCFDFQGRNNVDVIFGEFGVKIQTLIKKCDDKHPEFISFIKNIIGIDAINEIEDIIEIANFCKRKSKEHMIERLKKLSVNLKNSNFILNGRTIDDPLNTNFHTRFLSEENRWKVRDRKREQYLQYNKIWTSNEEEVLSEIFLCYHHNSEKTVELKKELERRKSIFESMNCIHMVNEMDSAIQKLNNEILLKNFGFRRITLSNIAMAYKRIFKDCGDILIKPINEAVFKSSKNIYSILSLCEKFPLFHSEYPVFDHYGLVGSDTEQYSIIVGERDTQTFFIGYNNNEEN